MNANPASAASVGVSPNVERLQGTPALQSTVTRAPERARAAVTALETFLSASALAEPLQSKVAVARLSTSTSFRSTLVVRARPSRHRLTRTFGINCGARRPRWSSTPRRDLPRFPAASSAATTRSLAGARWNALPFLTSRSHSDSKAFPRVRVRCSLAQR
jgi:hypothetical protein